MASSPSPTRSRDPMTPATDALTTHLIHLLRRVQRQLGEEESADDPATRFADALDSMGMVEFVAILAGECGVAPSAIEECVDRRFGTVADLAAAMSAVGLTPRRTDCESVQPPPGRIANPSYGPARQARPTRAESSSLVPCWLSTTVTAPPGGGPARRGHQCSPRPARGMVRAACGHRVAVPLGQARSPDRCRFGGRRLPARRGTRRADAVGVLLVTSEVPPRLAGLGRRCTIVSACGRMQSRWRSATPAPVSWRRRGRPNPCCRASGRSWSSPWRPLRTTWRFPRGRRARLPPCSATEPRPLSFATVPSVSSPCRSRA